MDELIFPQPKAANGFSVVSTRLYNPSYTCGVEVNVCLSYSNLSFEISQPLGNTTIDFTNSLPLHQIRHFMKVLCFGHAGGSEYSYMEFAKQFKEGQYSYMELPGHGRLMRRTPFVRFEEAINYHLDNIKEMVDRQESLVLFGHSLGSLIACEVTHKLVQQGYPVLGLIASGHSAPCKPNKRAHISTLNPNDFISEVDKIGGLPEQIKNDERILAIFEPILRADFSIITDYQYPINQPLDIPVVKIYGNNEGLEMHEIDAWQQETTLPLVKKEFVGNHFFVYEHWSAIANLVKQFETSEVES